MSDHYDYFNPVPVPARQPTQVEIRRRDLLKAFDALNKRARSAPPPAPKHEPPGFTLPGDDQFGLCDWCASRIAAGGNESMINNLARVQVGTIRRLCLVCSTPVWSQT